MHVLSNISVKPSENYLTSTLIPFFTDFTLLFMIVSGFSMCCGYYQRIKDGSVAPNTFYKKRYLRILPFFAILSLLDFALEPKLETLYQVYANLTLCFSLLPAHNITVIGVGWFLGIVFLFYLLFPFFVFMLDNRRRAWLSFALTLTFVLIAFNAEFVTGTVGRSNFVFCAPFFLSGGLVFMYRTGIEQTVRSHSIMCSLMVLLATVCYFVGKGVYSESINYIAELCMFSLWLVCAIGISSRVLSNKVLKYLSGISMEIYLAHMVIFRVVEKLHIEKYIEQTDMLYVATSLLTICGVVSFAHILKYHVVNKIESYL